jgi:hypothetical protein
MRLKLRGLAERLRDEARARGDIGDIEGRIRGILQAATDAVEKQGWTPGPRVRNVLKLSEFDVEAGRRELSDLSDEERARAGRFYRKQADLARGRFKEHARRYNLWRAIYLEGGETPPPRSLPLFVSMHDVMNESEAADFDEELLRRH